MAQLDPWDVHLEAVTQKLDQLIGGRLRGRVALIQAGGWSLEFRGSGRTLTVQLGNAMGVDAVPGDYARAIIYGCGFYPLGNEGRPDGFGKSLSMREGSRWDEESIREQVLEAIGILRYALGVPEASSVEFGDYTHKGAVAAAKSTVQRRHKR